MTEHDKLALLNMINTASDALQNVIAAEKEIINAKDVKYFKIVSDLHGIIHELIKTAEYNNCKVIWEDYKAVKIVEKEGKEDIEELPIVKGISIDKLYAMCDEIKSLDGVFLTYSLTKYVKVDEVTKIINKYIASEGK